VLVTVIPLDPQTFGQTSYLRPLLSACLQFKDIEITGCLNKYSIFFTQETLYKANVLCI